MSYALDLIRARLAGHPDRDRIVTLIAIADGGLPNPKPSSTDLDRYEADGLIKSGPYGWQITDRGRAAVEAVWKSDWVNVGRVMVTDRPYYHAEWHADRAEELTRVAQSKPMARWWRRWRRRSLLADAAMHANTRAIIDRMSKTETR
jgi:hypothetical protein